MVKKWKLAVVLCLLFFTIGALLIYSYNNFRVDEQFNSLPLLFNPADSTSIYEWKGNSVKIQGGFVKGKIIGKSSEELLLRSLSPNFKVTVKGTKDNNQSLVLRLENVNPVKTAIINTGQSFKVIDYHTVSLTVNLESNAEKTFEFAPKDDKDYVEFVILGDNRNGYQTFAQIIEQVNSLSPVFVIDNGDLVFGGEPNRYRLFYETVSKLQIPLYTTIGNHDIRENGRPTYAKLFGPPYYSFDYRNTHFIFLDSSRGWAEKRAIPEEQYQWLENDLKNAQGKRIFVISHIPPTDPRSNKEPNTLPDLPGVHQTGYFEKIMDNYSANKNLDHAFPDKEEAKRFENLMSKYKVDTVFLSHIHSYFSFMKDNVRYIISGGAGAELLTKDSYYHYIRVKVTGKDNYLEVVQLPSPPNKLQDRYLAALQLFAASTYKEYTTAVIIAGVFSALIVGWILWYTRRRWWPRIKLITVWLSAVLMFAVKKYKDLKTNRIQKL